MSEKQTEEFIKEMNEYNEKLLANKQKAVDFLISAGILTKEGKLDPIYTGE